MFFEVPEADWQDFYIVNWRNTLENPLIVSVALEIVVVRAQSVSEHGPSMYSKT